jgi:cytochrome c oxidase subunit 2
MATRFAASLAVPVGAIAVVATVHFRRDVVPAGQRICWLGPDGRAGTRTTNEVDAMNSRLMRTALGLAGLLASAGALAAEPSRWQLNLHEGVTQTSENAYHAHMLMLWVCVVIGVIVFGAMGYAMVKFRKSRGAVPDKEFTHSTLLESIWTAVPILILIASALPATRLVMAQYAADHDAKQPEMTVKITGYQWMWKYEYVGQDVAFISRLDRESDRLRQNRGSTQAEIAAHEHYLRDVDNRLVLPAETRVRFVITSDDVIHAWWVPALGWKQDAIPGVINEAWTEVSEPGVYRGVCAELCGKDHGFMPIVVEVMPKADYATWLAKRKAELAAADAPAAPAPAAATPAAETPADAPAVEAPAAPGAPSAPAPGGA